MSEQPYDPQTDPDTTHQDPEVEPGTVPHDEPVEDDDDDG